MRCGEQEKGGEKRGVEGIRGGILGAQRSDKRFLFCLPGLRLLAGGR